ncbi:hypothetical protein MXD63_32475 [Frankia sp. Cpl3]|nr:hypothetical protein [Frankia sp. Cpl3]
MRAADLLAFSLARAGLATTRTDLNRALTRFFEYCAAVGATVPEAVTLAETIYTWRVEITNALLRGLFNAAGKASVLRARRRRRTILSQYAQLVSGRERSTLRPGLGLRIRSPSTLLTLNRPDINRSDLARS